MDGVRVKLQVRPEPQGRGGKMEVAALVLHPNRRRPAALPSAWGNFLWGPEEMAFEVCRKSNSPATLSSSKGSSTAFRQA